MVGGKLGQSKANSWLPNACQYKVEIRIMYPKSQWIRIMFILCVEVDFECVPEISIRIIFDS